ncbi:MAG: ribose-phosphate pyrophosphokinase-like domain-containing protein, partial [Acidobacteria bacterium]|nr:ribose-phosphate pyrophosphokinase-like domain-containing protein [Acidobacteriota bacterium]
MSGSDMNDLKVFSGSAHPALAGEICRVLGIPLGRTECRRFADGEAYCQILENVRGTDVFVIQPTCPPADP